MDNNNNNNNNNNTFTWIFDTPQQQQVNSLFINDSDLFDFLMNPNQHQIEQEKKNNREMIKNNSDSSSKSTTSHSSDSSQSAGGEEGFISYKLDNIKSTDIIQKTPAEFTSSTGKLDFRHINSNITENQLKAMTSKERRQLRNKISARNFRNRRKEYIEGIEKELQQQKIENSQMKLEIKWLKSKVEQLQAENDKLRIDVVVLNSLPAPSVLAPYSSSPDTEPSPMLSNDNNNNNNAVDDWDFVLPDFPSSQPDTFISQAVVPSFNQVFLSKEQQQQQTHSSDLIRQYPLLAPALMSIVLSHTMTMSTDQLLASAKLIPPSPLPSKKETEAVWNLLEPIRVMNERNNRLVITDTEKQEEEEEEDEEEEKEEEKEKKEEPKCGVRRCLISLLQSTIYNHVAEMIANHKAKPIEEKPFLCRSYTKAMKYITA